MLRLLDILFTLLGLVVFSPLLIALAFLGWIDTRSPLFRQVRVGRDRKPFTLVKFRTMRPETAQVATHLADARAVTLFGRFLRRSKLDEFPQLWNVLKGDMSLVGPRPCLLSQDDLISARERLDVFNARPGITGLSQVSGIDMSTPELLAQTDARMLADLGLRNYFRYIFATLIGKGLGDRIIATPREE
jgi:O-antigen biosynthesis protein WbqP